MYVVFYNLNAPKECVAAIDVMEFVFCQLLVFLLFCCTGYVLGRLNIKYSNMFVIMHSLNEADIELLLCH